MSCAIAIYVLTGSGHLRAHAARIHAQISAAAKAPVEQLPLTDGGVDVVVRYNPPAVIPEVGIGGFAPDGHTVFLALDPDHEHFEWALEGELRRTLSHELHHVARWRGAARGNTLFDALVQEGLADHFSIELTGMEPPPWAVALSAEQTAVMRERAQEEYDNPRYNHRGWFLGSKDAEIPRWAGYSLGFQLVADYLARHPDTRASDLATAPSATLRVSA